MKKTILASLIAIATSIALIAQGTGIPSTIRVITDATGALLISSAAQTAPLSQPTVFTNTRLKTDSSGNLVVADGSGAGFAPANATYITQTANSTLTNEQAIASLSSGILRGATTTGVITSLGDILPVANGGTSFATYTVGDLISASATGTLSKITAVASGQVLASAGSATLPAYTANPSVTSITVKDDTGTDTFKAGGLLCATAPGSDNNTQNTWNATTCSISANAFQTAGDTLDFSFGVLGANNTNTHEYQIFFAPSTATCSGTNAALCDAGCTILSSVTDTTANAQNFISGFITKYGASNANTQGFSKRVVGTITSGSTGLCTVTENAASKLVIGFRNTSAAAATIQVLNSEVKYFGK